MASRAKQVAAFRDQREQRAQRERAAAAALALMPDFTIQFHGYFYKFEQYKHLSGAWNHFIGSEDSGPPQRWAGHAARSLEASALSVLEKAVGTTDNIYSGVMSVTRSTVVKILCWALYSSWAKVVPNADA